MRGLAAIVAGALLVAAFPAHAQRGFQAYEGPDAVQVGSGGTKVQGNGIDFWTTGTPPRRYRILGILVDSRGMGLLGGSPVNSKAFAGRVKEVGGDGVVVMGQDVAVRGAFVSNGVVGLARQQTTRFLVVRYEPAETEAAPPP